MAVVDLDKFRKLVQKLLAGFPQGEVDRLLDEAISTCRGKTAGEVAGIIASRILDDRWDEELEKDRTLEDLRGLPSNGPKP